MKLQVNDDSIEVNNDASLETLVEKLELQGYKLAIAVNNQVITKDKRNAFMLHENDKIIIIKAVSGG